MRCDCMAGEGGGFGPRACLGPASLESFRMVVERLVPFMRESVMLGRRRGLGSLRLSPDGEREIKMLAFEILMT